MAPGTNNSIVHKTSLIDHAKGLQQLPRPKHGAMGVFMSYMSTRQLVKNCNSAPICIVMGLVYLMRNPGLKKPQWSVMISVPTRDQLQLKYS